MTMYLWDLAHVTAVGDAIRAKTGDAASMTVEQMPSKIVGLLAPDEREVFLEKPITAPTTLFIDTGVYGGMEHTIEVKCRAFPGKMAAPFNSSTSNGGRQGFNMLSESNKLQVYWGGWSNTNVTLDRATEIDLNQTITVTQNKSGITVAGSKKNGGAGSYSLAYTATGTASTQTYKIFNYARNAEIHHGMLREAKVYDAGGVLIHDFVPVLKNDWTIYLLDKVTNERQVLPAGYIAHLDM